MVSSLFITRHQSAMMEVLKHTHQNILKEKTMQEFKTIGLDTAKNVFHFVGCDQRGKIKTRKMLRRGKVLEYFANIPACLVGMEACSSSHYWARELTKLGHTVKLIPAQHVKPYLRGNKNDYNDALAICEAVRNPEMRFVAVKTIEQQDQILINHKRQQVIDARTQQCNRIRAMLTERGVVIAKGIGQLKQALPRLLENTEQRLSDAFIQVLYQDYDYLQHLDKRLGAYDQQIKAINATSSACKRLRSMPGYGPILSSYFSSEIGDGRQFSKGRDASASLGIVPAQHSSGGKDVLLGISKRGNSRLRCLLIHGARSVVSNIGDKQDPLSQWIRQLLHRVGVHKATVAYANKMARTGWAMLRYETDFQVDYAMKHPAQTV
jgi:transposase